MQGAFSPALAIRPQGAKRTFKHMNCLAPVVAYDTGRINPDTGKRVIRFKHKVGMLHEHDILVPCGKCAACLENRRHRWIARCNLELLACHGDATFLTLTYNDAYCPPSLSREHLQLFFKRLRNVGRDYGLNVGSMRYFAVGEYGKKHHRPHYHIIIFGARMVDGQWLPYFVGCKPHTSFPIFASKVVERCWPYGFNTVDDVTPANVRYVSKYVSKQVVGDSLCLYSQGLGRSLFVDVKRQGRNQIFQSTPLLSRVSRSDKFSQRCGDSPSPLPSFALRYVDRFFPDRYQAIKRNRKAFSLSHTITSSTWFSPRLQAESVFVNNQIEAQKRILDNEW